MQKAQPNDCRIHIIFKFSIIGYHLLVHNRNINKAELMKATQNGSHYNAIWQKVNNETRKRIRMNLKPSDTSQNTSSTRVTTNNNVMETSHWSEFTRVSSGTDNAPRAVFSIKQLENEQTKDKEVRTNSITEEC